MVKNLEIVHMDSKSDGSIVATSVKLGVFISKDYEKLNRVLEPVIQQGTESTFFTGSFD